MIDIKFRVFVKDTGMIYFDLFDLDGNYIVSSDCYFDSKDHIMQYIGIKDKNKKDIYDGDIILIKIKEWDSDKEKYYWEKQIVWIKCSNLLYTKAYFDLEAKHCWDNGYSYEDWSDEWEENDNIAIIGNTHQNPELLEKSK